MAGATTVYNVLTRYSVQDHATGALTRYDSASRRADRSVVGLTRSTRSLGGSLAFLGRHVGPLAAGFSAYRAASATFRNLNQEMNSTLQVASQLNLAFDYGTRDPAENFVRSMGAARGLMRDMVRDAARLPGELSDFMGAMRTVGLPVFTTGQGTREDLRSLLGNLSIVAPMAGQSMSDAGRQVMRMMSGQTSIGDNPLFATLFSAGLLPNAASLNRLSGPEKLNAISAALERLAGNPVLRAEVIRTFDTQLGTLKDTLFGIEGIFGRIGRGPFDALLDGLTDFNKALDRHSDTIVGVTRFIIQNAQAGARQGSNLIDLLVPDVIEKSLGLGARVLGDIGNQVHLEKMAEERFNVLTDQTRYVRNFLVDQWQHGTDTLQIENAAADAFRDLQFRFQEELAGGFRLPADFIAEAIFERLHPPEDGKDEGTRRSTPQNIVHQTVNVKVDLRSDDSPEAVAVKMTEAIQKTQTFPKRAQRSVRLVPGPSGTT